MLQAIDQGAIDGSGSNGMSDEFYNRRIRRGNGSLSKRWIEGASNGSGSNRRSDECYKELSREQAMDQEASDGSGSKRWIMKEAMDQGASYGSGSNRRSDNNILSGSKRWMEGTNNGWKEQEMDQGANDGW